MRWLVKRGEVGARVLSFGGKRLTGMGLRLGRWMPGDAPMSLLILPELEGLFEASQDD